MELIYIKLNDYDSLKGFPLCVAGILSDGINTNLIVLPLQGEIIFKSNKSILEADEEIKKTFNWKKIPGDVVVQIKKISEYPALT